MSRGRFQVHIPNKYPKLKITRPEEVNELLNLLLKRGCEQFEKQILLPRVSAIVKQLQNNSLNELGCVGNGQNEQQFSQIDGVRLQQIEQILVELHFVVVFFAQLFDAVRLVQLDVLFVFSQFFVLRQNILETETNHFNSSFRGSKTIDSLVTLFGF